MPTQDDYATALKEIAEGLLVSSEPPLEKIVERVFRVYQIAQDACAQYTLYVGAQQKRAEKAEVALAKTKTVLAEIAGMGMLPEQSLSLEKIVEEALLMYRVRLDTCAYYCTQMIRAAKDRAALDLAINALYKYAYGAVPWRDKRGIAKRALAKIQEMQGESHE